MEFDSCFKFTTQDGPIIRFLNFRTIQSHHVISIDQTEHTLQNILDDYWIDKDNSKLSWLSSPFPTISSFEIKLFDEIPLLPGEKTSLVKFHNGSLEKWVGALMNIRVGVRLDISYSVMRLSTYMSHPTKPEYEALHHCMIYLLHHPHLPIMYPRKPLKKNPLGFNFNKGVAELSSSYNKLEYDAYHDADIARDLCDRRSVDFNMHMMNGVAIDWKFHKQPTVATHSNDAEIRYLYSVVKDTFCIRNFLTSIGYPIVDPAPTFEDNQLQLHRYLRIGYLLAHVQLMF